MSVRVHARARTLPNLATPRVVKLCSWMSWQTFRCGTNCTAFPADCISERLYRETADALEATGLLAAGYNTVHLDDCIVAKARDPVTNELVADPQRFPSGFNALGASVPGKGAKFGFYTAMSTTTCGSYPASAGFEELDANTFAGWGVECVARLSALRALRGGGFLRRYATAAVAARGRGAASATLPQLPSRCPLHRNVSGALPAFPLAAPLLLTSLFARFLLSASSPALTYAATSRSTGAATRPTTRWATASSAMRCRRAAATLCILARGRRTLATTSRRSPLQPLSQRAATCGATSLTWALWVAQFLRLNVSDPPARP